MKWNLLDWIGMEWNHTDVFFLPRFICDLQNILSSNSLKISFMSFRIELSIIYSAAFTLFAYVQYVLLLRG